MSSPRKEWHEEVTEPGALPKALVSISMAGGGLAVCVATAGLAMPVYVGVSAFVGAAFTVAGAAACQGLDKLNGRREGPINTGDMLGCALVGAIGCGATGAAGCIAADVVIQPWQCIRLRSPDVDLQPWQVVVLHPVLAVGKCRTSDDDGSLDAQVPSQAVLVGKRWADDDGSRDAGVPSLAIAG